MTKPIVPGLHSDSEYRSPLALEAPFVSHQSHEMGPHRPASWSAAPPRYARRRLTRRAEKCTSDFVTSLVTALIAALAILGAAFAPPTSAQIVVPGAHHYTDAYETIARSKALANLRVLDELAESAARAAAMAEARRLAATARQDAVVDLWATYIQRQHGIRPGSHRRGTGWHKVHRGN